MHTCTHRCASVVYGVRRWSSELESDFLGLNIAALYFLTGLGCCVEGSKGSKSELSEELEEEV